MHSTTESSDCLRLRADKKIKNTIFRNDLYFSFAVTVGHIFQVGGRIIYFACKIRLVLHSLKGFEEEC